LIIINNFLFEADKDSISQDSRIKFEFEALFPEAKKETASAIACRL